MLRVCIGTEDQWNAQAIVKRMDKSLIERGYVTWLDLTNMKGSTMDAMSDAIEGCVISAHVEHIQPTK